MRPRFHPEADAEIDDAADHYLNISVALAIRFTGAIESGIGMIESRPRMFPRTDLPVPAREVRSLSLDDFPYSMIYGSARAKPSSSPSPITAAGRDTGSDANPELCRADRRAFIRSKGDP